MKKTIILMLILACFIGCGQKVGSDRDKHGCIGSAGYTWCEAKQKCLRQWEEPCVNDTEENDLRSRCLSLGGKWIDEPEECERISEADCINLGGTFIECASACRNNPEADACIAVCIPLCKFETVGGQRDEHGCPGPAGYSWDDEIGACTRSWEITDKNREIVKMAVSVQSFYPIIVESVEQGDCDTCFTVVLQQGDSGGRIPMKFKEGKVTG